VFFSLLHESNIDFIEDIDSRHTTCVTQFIKETDTEHCFETVRHSEMLFLDYSKHMYTY